MNAEIVAIGTELTLGTTVDINSSWLAQQLATLGVLVGRITLVGDDIRQITEAIRESWDRAELVLCAGGLGPTADDLTREAVAAALGRPLEFHPELLEQIAARFRSFGRTMSESNRQQAYIPAGARPIPNARGTAPSFIVQEGAKSLMVFPGVPSELKFLTETELLPFLRDERGMRSVLLVRSVRLSGLSEAEAGEIIADLMQAPYPTVGISAKAAQHEVRISAQGEDRVQVEADLEQTAAEVRRRLSKYVMDKGHLALQVSGMLKEAGQTLALYEGFREAPIFAALQAAPHGLHVLRGATIHPLDQPIDAPAAELLARNAAIQVRDEWRASFGLAAQPAQPGDDGWTDVCLAIASASGERIFRRRVDLASADSLGFVGNGALEFLRRSLIDLAAEDRPS